MNHPFDLLASAACDRRSWTVVMLSFVFTGYAVAQTARTTANQGLAAAYGWRDPDGSPDPGRNSIGFLVANADSTMPASGRLYNTVGDPAADVSLPAYNGNYTLTFKLTATTPTITPGNNSTITASLTTEYSINSGGTWFSVGGSSQVTATGSTPGVFTTVQTFTPTLNFPGGGPVWIRLILRGTSSGTLPGGVARVQVYASSGWTSDPYAVTWSNIPGKPVVDASPYNFDNQDYVRCAQSCFAAVYTQSTVPYYSLDLARSVSLAYNGDRVNPKPFVAVNVKPDVAYGTTPIKYQLQVKVNGALVTFLNTPAEQTLNFAYVGTSPARIGGQFDASSYTTGVYPLEILVTAVYPTTSLTASVTTKLAIVNETTNPVARGWTIAGIQRLYSQADGSALVTDGSGSAIYFQKVGSVFISPAGEYSNLVTGTPSGGSGWTRRFSDSTKVVFDATGKMSEVRDRFVSISTVTYDGNGRIWKITDPNSKIITLAYGTNGLNTITDAGSPARVTTVTVDGSKRLTFIQDPDNVGTAFGYDAGLRLSTITDRRGFATTLGYDAQSGKLASITRPPVEVVNDDGSLATASPITTLESWQKKGVPYGSTSTPMTPPQADTVYARVTDPGGHAVRLTVNRWGTAAIVRDTLGRTDSTRFDAGGMPIRIRYATGAVDTAAYNVRGLPTWLKKSGYPGMNFRYAGWAQPDSIWSADGSKGVRNFIGANGRIDSVRVAGGTSEALTTRYRYDTRGRVDSIADGAHSLVRKAKYLGTNGNMSRLEMPGGRFTTYTYDAYGRLKVVAPDGLAPDTTFFSVINRPDSTRNGITPATRYTYDALFLTGLTDPKGQVYGFAYNAIGWLTQRTDPLSRSEVKKYSRDGYLRRWTNRRSETVDFAFDLLHRRVSKSGTNTVTETWSYPNDTVVVATSPVAQDTFVVNRHGQSVRRVTVMGGKAFVRRSVYTTAGLLDSVIPTATGHSFKARHYVWNTQRGELDTITLGSSVTGLDNNISGLPSAITLPGGHQFLNAYASTDKIAEMTTTESFHTTTDRFVSLDIVGRIQNHIGGSGTIGRQYSYDTMGRLTGDSLITWQPGSDPNPCDPPRPPAGDNGSVCAANGTGGTGTWVVLGGYRYSYDSVGNRRDNGGSYTTGNRISAYSGCTYQTDFDGNVTQRVCGPETLDFTWSAESRLIGLSVNGKAIGFHYDAQGQLIRKDTSGLRQLYFLWDGKNLLAELDSNAVTKRAEYSYYPGLDNIHATVVSDTEYYAHRDAIGNTIAYTTDANLGATFDYDAWGALGGGGTTPALDHARFKGAMWAGPEVELYFMRARWYEPKTGRFLSEDPAGLAGGINPYTYAGNDPINNRDPLGLDYDCVLTWIEYYVDDVLVGINYITLVCHTDGVTKRGTGGGDQPPSGGGGSGNGNGTSDAQLCHSVQIDNPSAPPCVLRPPTADERARLWKIYKGLLDGDRFCRQFAIPLRNIIAEDRVLVYDTHYAMGPGETLWGDTDKDTGEIHLYNQVQNGKGWIWPRTVVHEVAHDMPEGLNQFDHPPGGSFDWDGQCDVPV